MILWGKFSMTKVIPHIILIMLYAKDSKAAKLEDRHLSSVNDVDPRTTSVSGIASTSSASLAQTTANVDSSIVESSSSSVVLTVNMTLTTTFTQPTDCSGGITQLYTNSTNLWEGIIDPAPSAIVTTCNPPQFIASYLATSSLPAFEKIVCPHQWENYNINSTYVICCPRGYSLYAPNWDDSQRPGLYAACTSSIWADMLMTVTSYNSQGSTSVFTTTAPSSGAMVVAQAYDGNIFTPTVVSDGPTTTTDSYLLSTYVTSTSEYSSSTTSETSDSPMSSLATESPLPSCGQQCFDTMVAQYSSLNCSSADPFCLCSNVNFGYGIRDCSNGACGTAVARTIIAYASAYCASATSLVLPPAATELPSCGWTCLGNMFGQYQSLGCSNPNGGCLCKNANFRDGMRDCSNGACDNAGAANTVISFASSYCASETAIFTATAGGTLKEF